MRLIASDLDGTIIGRDGRISDRTVRAFRSARQAGVEIVFVTGRPPRWLDPLREQLDQVGTVICSNGAVTYDLAGERLIRAQTLERRSVLEVRGIIRELYPAATFAAETVAGFHLEPGFVEPGSVELLAGIEPQWLEESLNGDGVVKFLARERTISPDEFLAGVGPAISRLASTTHSAPGTALLEISKAGINKGVTLADYAASLGIGAAEVVAFGDMPNDIQMLEWAGHGYAMASGHPAARAAARRLAPGIEDDGVAQVIEARLAGLPG